MLKRSLLVLLLSFGISTLAQADGRGVVAGKENSMEDFFAALDRAKLENDAKKAQEDGIWTEAQQANSVAGYQRYVSEFPNGKYIGQAVIALSGLYQTKQ